MARRTRSTEQVQYDSQRWLIEENRLAELQAAEDRNRRLRQEWSDIYEQNNQLLQENNALRRENEALRERVDLYLGHKKSRQVDEEEEE